MTRQRTPAELAEEQKAFDRGVAAQASGRSREGNPFRSTAFAHAWRERDAWWRGWDEGQRIEEVANPIHPVDVFRELAEERVPEYQRAEGWAEAFERLRALL